MYKYNLMQRYGITLEEKKSIFDLQNGVCGICGKDNHGGKNWHIDHNHVTGEVRGILCSGCNVMIAHAHDNPNTLELGAAYLRGYETN